MIKTRFALTLAPLAAAIAFAPAAFAADTSVTWRDLDLQTESGKAELDARVDQAAQTVCANQTITGTRVQRGPSSACLVSARDQIKSQIAARIARNEAKAPRAQSSAAVAIR